MHFRNHILLYVLVPLIVLSAGVSYYHFILANEYVVEYEGECDPTTESCFEGCEDDTCENTYPYKVMEKRASSVRAACGTDITDCADASVCLPDDLECSIEYCDPSTLDEGEYCFSAEVEESEEGSADEEQIEVTS
jgi:hypothetical protein